MENIRELSFEEIEQVSGGNANSNYEGGRSSSRGNNQSNGGREGAPVTTANNAGIGIIAGTLGALAGLAGGPAGALVAGAVLGGLGAAMPTPSSSSNGKSGGGWHDSNPGSVAGQCRW